MSADDFARWDPTAPDSRPMSEGEEVEVTLTIECRVKARLVNVSPDGSSADLESEPFTADTDYVITGTVIHRQEP
jgi:uncharacterized protein (DUF58 family)